MRWQRLRRDARARNRAEWREIKQIEAVPMGDAEFTDLKSRRASTAQRLFANFVENPSVWVARPDGLERINVVRYASASRVAG